ncbi:hypothetical protein H0H93_008598 [Arthromyces matolae]|nr:hypothetical protein H0H93_008598 [Arthromyces matolae]
MRVTRSSSRAQATSNTISRTTQGKRKVEDETPNPPNKKRTTSTSRQDNDILQPEISKILPMTVPVDNGGQAELTIVPATLTFSFEEGKKHLISVDHRFYDLFSKMPCKPFEHLEAVHPFRALATSIIGQQISWLAARSVKHKFVRLFDPSIPEKIEDYESVLLLSKIPRRLNPSFREHSRPSAFFPSPTVVAKTDVATLRTAGLSQRKAEYVLDLAQQFADGRLSTDKLIDANDEDLAKMLIAVRGIGKVCFPATSQTPINQKICSGQVAMTHQQAWQSN